MLFCIIWYLLEIIKRIVHSTIADFICFNTFFNLFIYFFLSLLGPRSLKYRNYQNSPKNCQKTPLLTEVSNDNLMIL